MKVKISSLAVGLSLLGCSDSSCCHTNKETVREEVGAKPILSAPATKVKEPCKIFIDNEEVNNEGKDTFAPYATFTIEGECEYNITSLYNDREIDLDCIDNQCTLTKYCIEEVHIETDSGNYIFLKDDDA